MSERPRRGGENAGAGIPQWFLTGRGLWQRVGSAKHTGGGHLKRSGREINRGLVGCLVMSVLGDPWVAGGAAVFDDVQFGGVGMGGTARWVGLEVVALSGVGPGSSLAQVSRSLHWCRRGGLGMGRGAVSLVSGVGSDVVPVGPDVERVVVEHDGCVVGLFVGESVGAPTGDGAAGDADAGGEGADGWVAGGGEERV